VPCFVFLCAVLLWISSHVSLCAVLLWISSPVLHIKLSAATPSFALLNVCVSGTQEWPLSLITPVAAQHPDSDPEDLLEDRGRTTARTGPQTPTRRQRHPDREFEDQNEARSNQAPKSRKKSRSKPKHRSDQNATFGERAEGPAGQREGPVGASPTAPVISGAEPGPRCDPQVPVEQLLHHRHQLARGGTGSDPGGGAFLRLHTAVQQHAAVHDSSAVLRTNQQILSRADRLAARNARKTSREHQQFGEAAPEVFEPNVSVPAKAEEVVGPSEVSPGTAIDMCSEPREASEGREEAGET
jgi:hypothetical protein